ncbi:type I-E CRISPR-associated protein Cse2/CasB [Streptomyces maremycinicus]|nr:type I-E CRISPR-associated protein Cse2/CasB [Streptomyces sp. B9173]
MTAPASSLPLSASRTGLYRAYVARIETVCAEDPGARVALRRGLRRGLDDVPGMHRIVAAWLPDHRTEAEERAFYAVAALIADRPRHSFRTSADDDAGTGKTPKTEEASESSPPAGNEPAGTSDTGQSQSRQQQHGARPDSLGASCARAVLGQAGRGLREETAEARLNLLTRQSLPGLHRHLPGTVRHLRDAGADIDFAVLLTDLATWPHQSKRTARRWLQDYYRLRRAHIEQQAQSRDDDEAFDLTTGT